GEAVFNQNGDITHLQGLVTDAQDEHNLRNQMIKSQQLQKHTNDEISKLAQNIANSVRDLSILSINARIEAAHAGKAGRGFSVVASEMSDLAEMNAKWAKDISQRML
ncbi:MAG: methyl-accepting chemotaxis protein, partial [Candidatus Azotimanducaceae bacterium]